MRLPQRSKQTKDKSEDSQRHSSIKLVALTFLSFCTPPTHRNFAQSFKSLSPHHHNLLLLQTNHHTQCLSKFKFTSPRCRTSATTSKASQTSISFSATPKQCAPGSRPWTLASPKALCTTRPLFVCGSCASASKHHNISCLHFL